MRVSGWILTTALVVPLTVAGQNANPNSMGSSQSPQVSLQAQHFLNLIASEDQSEINLAKLALKKSSNPQIQQYARTSILAADPSMKQDALKIAEQNHAPVDGFPTSADKAEFYYLSKLSGKAFDKAYMDYEDAKQREDLILVQNEATAAKNQQLRKYAEKEEGPVQQAAESAKRIAQSIGA
jgi:putative membrane protein